MLHRVARVLESRGATKITLELVHVMTLAHLHIRFPTCHCLPLGIGVICVLSTLEIDCYQDSLPQNIVLSCGLLSVWDLSLSPQHGGSGPLRFHEVRW